ATPRPEAYRPRPRPECRGIALWRLRGLTLGAPCRRTLPFPPSPRGAVRPIAKRCTCSPHAPFRQTLPVESRAMNRDQIQFPPRHAALREDVHTLGMLIGELLKEQGGPRLLEMVEQNR